MAINGNMDIGGFDHTNSVGKKNKFQEFIEDTTNSVSAKAAHASKVLPGLLSGNMNTEAASSTSSSAYQS